MRGVRRDCSGTPAGEWDSTPSALSLVVVVLEQGLSVTKVVTENYAESDKVVVEDGDLGEPRRGAVVDHHLPRQAAPLPWDL